MPTIRETAHRHAQNTGLRQYMGQAEPILSALEQREQEAVATLIEVAASQGIDEVTVLNAVRQAGLSTPPGLTAQSGGDDSDLSQRVAELTRSVDTLMNVARSRGLL